MNSSFSRDLRAAARPLARLLGSVPGGKTLGSWALGRAWGLPAEDVDFHAAFKLVPTIQFCVEIYQSTLSATPLRFYSGEGDKRIEIDRKDGNVADLWARGNSEDTGPDLVEQIVGSRQLQGVAYLFKDYLGRSTPQQFWCINPLHVTPILAENGRGVAYYKVRSGGEEIPVPREQIVAFRRYDPDLGVSGVSRVGALRLAYETQRDGARFMRGFYKRGGTIAGHYSTENSLDVDEIESLKKDLHERVQGPEHAWEPVILPRKLKFERAGLTFAEMQFIESARLTKSEMLTLFKIPPMLAGSSEGSGLNSDVASVSMLLFLRFAIFPEAHAIARVLNERLLASGEFGDGVSCEFDFAKDPVLVESWLKQAEAWVRATGGPLATRAEAREKLGLRDRSDEFPTLDEPLVPSSMLSESDFSDPPEAPPATALPPKPKPVEEPNAADPIEETRAISRDRRDAFRVRGDRLLSIHERRWRSESSRMFRAQNRRFVAALRASERDLGARFYLAKAVDLDALLATLEDEGDRRRVRRLIRAIVMDAGTAAIAELAQEVAFDLTAKAVEAFVSSKGARYVTLVNATTRAALRDALAEGVANSDTLGDLVARVDEVFAGRRANAQTIARTETAAAYNFATEEGYRQSGVVEKKQWLTSQDEAVRDSHAEADGQEVPLGASFVVGGESLAYPGDPSGDAANVINCRCTMVPVVRAEKTESAPLPARIAQRLNGSVRPTAAASTNGNRAGNAGLSVEEWLRGS